MLRCGGLVVNTLPRFFARLLHDRCDTGVWSRLVDVRGRRIDASPVSLWSPTHDRFDHPHPAPFPPGLRPHPSPAGGPPPPPPPPPQPGRRTGPSPRPPTRPT